MIQRIQTLFLFAIIILFTVMLFMPLWEKVGPDGTKLLLNCFELKKIGPDHIVETKPAWYIAFGAISSISMTFSTIFQYKNRTRQMMLSSLMSFFIGGTLIAIIILSKKADAGFNPNIEGTLQWAAWLPIPALVCNFLAKVYIRKDEKLVKSVDRLR